MSRHQERSGGADALGAASADEHAQPGRGQTGPSPANGSQRGSCAMAGFCGEVVAHAARDPITSPRIALDHIPEPPELAAQVKTLRANTDVPGKEVLREMLGIKQSTLQAALRILEDRGELFNAGTVKAPRLRLRALHAPGAV